MEYICPSCKQPIYDDEALLCHFCGESLRRGSSGALGQMKYSRHKWLAILMALCILAGLVMCMVW